MWKSTYFTYQDFSSSYKTQPLSKDDFYIFFFCDMNSQIIIWMIQPQDFCFLFILETLQGLPRGKSSNVSTITHKNCVQSLLSLFSDFSYPQVLSAELILYFIYLSCHFYCYPCSAPWFKVSIFFNICFSYKSFYLTFYIFKGFCKYFLYDCE